MKIDWPLIQSATTVLQAVIFTLGIPLYKKVMDARDKRFTASVQSTLTKIVEEEAFSKALAKGVVREINGTLLYSKRKEQDLVNDSLRNSLDRVEETLREQAFTRDQMHQENSSKQEEHTQRLAAIESELSKLPRRRKAS